MKTKTILTTGMAAALLGAVVQSASATPVTGWGAETGFQNGPAVSGDSGGNFSVSGANITGNYTPRALFPTLSLNVGDTITLTGSFAFTSGNIGNQQFRIGLYNSNGAATGTLAGGLWSGANPLGWLGYMFEPGTGTGNSTALVERNNPNTGNWFSGTGATTISTVASGADALLGSYNFSLSLNLTSATSYDIAYAFTQTAGGTYVTSGTFTDTSASTTSFNAVGFLMNANVGGGVQPFTFGNVDVSVTSVPEPGTLSLIGLAGLACLFRLRRASV